MADDRVIENKPTKKTKAKTKLPRGVRRRGNCFIVSFALPDGKICVRSVGYVSVQEAQRKRLEFKRQIALGTYEGWKPRPKQYTCSDLWEAYLREYSNRSGRDTYRLTLAWTNNLKPIFGTMRTDQVSTDDVNKYIEGRRADGVQGGTINREIALLKAMLHFGTRQTPVKESPPRDGFVTDTQINSWPRKQNTCGCGH